MATKIKDAVKRLIQQGESSLSKIPMKEQKRYGADGTFTMPDFEKMLQTAIDKGDKTALGKLNAAIKRAVTNKVGKKTMGAVDTVGKAVGSMAAYVPKTIAEAGGNYMQVSAEPITGNTISEKLQSAVGKEFRKGAAALPAGMAIVGGGLAGQATAGMPVASAAQRILQGAATGGLMGGAVGATGGFSQAVGERLSPVESAKRVVGGIGQGVASGALLGGAFAGAGEAVRGVKSAMQPPMPESNTFDVRPVSYEDFINEVLPRTREGYYGTGTPQQQYKAMLSKNPNLSIARLPNGKVFSIDDRSNISGMITRFNEVEALSANEKAFYDMKARTSDLSHDDIISQIKGNIRHPITNEPPTGADMSAKSGTLLQSVPEASKKTYYKIDKQPDGKWGATWVSGRENGEIVELGGSYYFKTPEEARAWANQYKGRDMGGNTGEMWAGELPKQFEKVLQYNQGIRDNYVGKIMAYEDGSLSEADTIKMFQEMVNDGSVWKLQGSYGRTAQAMLDAGVIQPPTKATTDYYGNKIPTKGQPPTGAEMKIDKATSDQVDALLAKAPQKAQKIALIEDALAHIDSYGDKGSPTAKADMRAYLNQKLNAINSGGTGTAGTGEGISLTKMPEVKQIYDSLDDNEKVGIQIGMIPIKVQKAMEALDAKGVNGMAELMKYDELVRSSRGEGTINTYAKSMVGKTPPEGSDLKMQQVKGTSAEDWLSGKYDKGVTVDQNNNLVPSVSESDFLSVTKPERAAQYQKLSADEKTQLLTNPELIKKVNELKASGFSFAPPAGSEMSFGQKGPPKTEAELQRYISDINAMISRGKITPEQGGQALNDIVNNYGVVDSSGKPQGVDMKNFPAGSELKVGNTPAVESFIAGDVGKQFSSQSLISEMTKAGDKVLYSYGKHYPLAVITKDGQAFVNIDKYSRTTSGHQGEVGYALSNAGMEPTKLTTNQMQKLVEKGAQAVQSAIDKGGASRSTYGSIGRMGGGGFGSEQQMERPSTVVQFGPKGKDEIKFEEDDRGRLFFNKSVPDWYNEVVSGARKWVSSDAWRGHFETPIKEGMVKLGSGWVTGYPDDTVAHKQTAADVFEKLQSGELKPPKPIYWLFEPTSNVFSTASDLMVKKADLPAVTQWFSKMGVDLKSLADAFN